MTDEYPDGMIQGEPNKALHEALAQARAQRDFVGQAAKHWIGRYYALKAAHGEIAVEAVAALAQRELQQLEAAANQGAAE